MTILDTIVSDTRLLVAQRKSTLSFRDLEDQPLYARIPLALKNVLHGENLAIITEIKKASPSKGLIRSEFHPRELAIQYERNGASAISVLTEPTHFKGSLEDLADVRNTVNLPLLRKDFIFDPYQLVEARAYGADAILLIASILDPVELFDLHQAAENLGLSCLVELHAIEEIEKVDFDQVQIIGVNNRDLRTFQVDINHSLHVFNHIPIDAIRVSESGLRSAADLIHLHKNGVDAVLIGETLMRADEPGRILQDLIRHVIS